MWTSEPAPTASESPSSAGRSLPLEFGATLGPILAFAYLAANAANREPRR